MIGMLQAGGGADGEKKSFLGSVFSTRLAH